MSQINRSHNSTTKLLIMASAMYDITDEEINTIMNDNISSFITDLMKLKNTFSKNNSKEIPMDLKMSIFHVGKLWKMWKFRKDQIQNQMEQINKQNKEEEKKSSVKDDEDANDSDSESISDVDYDSDHQKEINKLLALSELESSLARSNKGFTIESKPEYVITS